MAATILVVEDEDPKLEGIQKFLKDFDATLDISFARSVKSGLNRLGVELPDVLLLDMSLPTFDITGFEPGGRPQGFGGMEIVRYLDSLESRVPTIVVSAYDAFARDGKSVELKDLALELVTDFPDMIRGVVYFNPIHDQWSDELATLIRSCLPIR
jgi:CheY-like chemotaxis protein